MNCIRRVFVTIALSSLIAVSQVLAAQTGCPEHFLDKQAPEIIDQKLTLNTREVCYSGYAIKHSGVTKTPLYAAEYLTRERLLQGKGMKRQSKFHPDDHIPVYERAELIDYSRSGYDRGHVAPSADMFDVQSQFESFSLGNMVPQVPENNRGPWEGIESTVRKMVKSRGALYVITGPIFQGEYLQIIGNKVMVPTKLFKAVYDPKSQEAGAYLIKNAVDAQSEKISVAELEKITGINVFPSLGEKVKLNKMVLPEPKSYKERRAKGER